MNDLCNRLPGYYKALIPEKHGSKPLMHLSAAGIYYYDAVPTESGIELKISMFGMTKAMQVAKVHGFELTELCGIGLPFLFHRYRKRFGIYTGAVIVCLMLFMSQLFVWQVDVNGNKKLSESEVKRLAEQCGVYVGAFIPDIRVFSSETRMLLLEDDISSVAINLKGTHAEIELIERVHAPVLMPTDGACEIAASEDGVIVKIEAAKGVPAVNVGDRVTKGQLLIRGDVTTDEGYRYLCRAVGNVYAEVEYDFSAKVTTSITRKAYTGRTERKTALSFLGHQLPLTDSECGFEYADCESEMKELTLFGMSTTLFKTELIYREFEYAQTEIGTSAAKDRCLLLLRQHLKSQKCEVKSYYYEINKKGDAYVIDAHITVIRNIAVSAPIGQSTEPSESPSASESNDRT